MHFSPTAQQWLSVLPAAATAVLFWIGLLYFVSFVTCWLKLARRFRTLQAPEGQVLKAGPWITIYMHMWTRYSGIVRVAAAEDALYLSVILPFRPGHPPLRIPWNEIVFGKRRYSFLRFVELRLGLTERVPLRLSQKLAARLDLLKRLPPQ